MFTFILINTVLIPPISSVLDVKQLLVLQRIKYIITQDRQQSKTLILLLSSIVDQKSETGLSISIYRPTFLSAVLQSLRAFSTVAYPV